MLMGRGFVRSAFESQLLLTKPHRPRDKDSVHRTAVCVLFSKNMCTLQYFPPSNSSRLEESAFHQLPRTWEYPRALDDGKPLGAVQLGFEAFTVWRFPLLLFIILRTHDSLVYVLLWCIVAYSGVYWCIVGDTRQRKGELLLS